MLRFRHDRGELQSQNSQDDWRAYGADDVAASSVPIKKLRFLTGADYG